MSFKALCQGKYPRYAITIYFLIGLLSFAVDLPVAMETTEHAEIELPVSRSHSSDGSHIKKKRSISKVTSYSLELVICVRLMRMQEKGDSLSSCGNSPVFTFFLQAIVIP